jgi:F5/8 type C domain
VRQMWTPGGAMTAVVALLLVAGACGGGDSDAATEVRPFAEVQDGDLAIEPDPSDPTRAILRLTTTEPMICAVVWGEDESFGRLNNSLSMNGTGITDHDVLLPDVEPGVTYSYVIQGTTANGALYRSDIGTFSVDSPAGGTTPVPPFAQGDNLALDATVTEVSSEFSDAFAAEQAIDDDTDTEWSTAGDGDDGSITVDLGVPQRIAGIEFVTRSMADGSAITDTYTVTVDGGQPLGPFPAGTSASPRPSQVDVTGRVLRFDVETSSGGNVGAVEIRIYAPTG